MRLEDQRYFAVAADATRSIIFMLGENGRNGIIPVNDGPYFNARRDPRMLWLVRAGVFRNNTLVPGVALQFVTLTGIQGGLFWSILGEGIQGSGFRPSLRGPVPVTHGIGVSVFAGGLVDGDEIDLVAFYD